MDEARCVTDHQLVIYVHECNLHCVDRYVMFGMCEKNELGDKGTKIIVL